MPRVSCVVFAAKHLRPEVVKGKRIIDIGACDFNGSIRPLLMSYDPEQYLGIDIIPGPCVDRVLSASDIAMEYGENSFDVVLSIEMMEHCRDWHTALTNMKRVCKPGGLIVITTPARGYPYHGYPNDFWRYETDDFKTLFDDFEAVETEKDPSGPGSFVCARKPQNFKENDHSNFGLFSVVTNRVVSHLRDDDFKSWHFKKVFIKQMLKQGIEKTYHKLGELTTRLLRLR
jgi:SAM-dependent methyltransferase